MARYTPETYFLNPAHENIACARYYRKDESGLPIEKNIFESFKRVNDYIYQNDSIENKNLAQRLCEDKKIMYAGRPLAQAGTGIENMFNCFVLGIGDSREEISEAQRIHFHIQAHGGGTGLNFSSLRPSGAWCKGANARSSGPEGFITAMGYLSSNISQGGNRSGANMGILEDNHPGLLNFITKKSRSNWENIRKFAVVTDENKFKQWQWCNPHDWQTFNVSVALSDDFMRQVKRKLKKPWKLQWSGEEWSLWDYKMNLVDYLPSGDSITTEVPITVCAPDETIALHEALNQVPFRNASVLEKVSGPYHLTAHEWFRRICTNAWEDGCPGIFFIDRARAFHNGEYFNPLDATNPCYAGDQHLLTSNGYKTFKELYDAQEPVSLVQDARVVYSGPEKDNNNPGYWHIEPKNKGFITNNASSVFLTKKNSDIVKIKTVDGIEVRCTPDHHMAVLDRGMIEAKDLKQNDKLLIADTPLIAEVDKNSLDYILGMLYGLFLGDGHVNTSNTSDKIILGLWGEDIEQSILIEKSIQRIYDEYAPYLRMGDSGRFLSPYFISFIPNRKELRIESTYLKRVFENLDIFDGKDKYIYSSGKLKSSEFYAGLFSGLFFADGTVSYNNSNGNLSIRFCSSRSDVLSNLQLRAFIYGAPSRIYKRRQSCVQVMPDGKGGEKEYLRKASYELIFSGLSRDRIVNVMDIFGRKREKYEENRAKISLVPRTFWSKVDTVVPDGKEDVYCIAENNRRTVIVNGVTGRRCAEQVLPPWSVCCLSSLVLPEFVDDDGSIDWDGIKEAVCVLVRSLNWITLLNRTGVEEIDQNTLRERRIGLGTIGMHELLIRMSMRGGRDYIYSQDSGRAMAKKILKFIKHSAYEASIEMAKEIGPFPEFKFDEFVKSKFIQQLLKERPDLEEQLREHGIANVTILTQAPTGTTGTITGYSSGCEPYFAMSYLRNSNIGTIPDGCPSFMQWVEEKEIDYAKYGYNLKELKKHKRVPKYFEEAQDISWKDHLAMQAVFSEQVDSSVSKCLAEGTLINTNKGLIPIEQCGFARGEGVFGKPLEDLRVIDENGQHQKITSHYSAGEKEATRIILQNGASICGARDSHKVKTIDGWKTLGALTPTDLVFINDDFEVFDVENRAPINTNFDRNTNANYVNLPDKMSVYLAKLLGMLVADGHLQESTGKVSLYEKDTGNLGGFYDSLAEHVFGVAPEVYIDERTSVVEHRITSRTLVRYLKELIGYRSDNKKVPNQILCGSFEEKRHFLEGLTLDGYLRKGRGLVVYEGKSKILAYQSAELLRSFGKPRVYCGKKWVKTHDYYVYSVMVSDELQDTITPLELHKCEPKSCGVRSHLVAFDPDDLLTLSISSNHPRYSAVRNLRQRKIAYCTCDLAEDLGLEIIGKVAKVSTVENLEKIPMYDIEVDRTHNYLVSGIVSHNTINLPSSATVDDIMGAYIGAFDSNIKSTAVYRDGSKTQVLETLKNYAKNADARPQTIVTMNAPFRPTDLDCDIHAVSVKGDRWKVLVGLLHGRPYEIFCFPEEQIEISPSRHDGVLRKNGQGRYNLIIGTGEDTWTIKNVAQFLLNDEHRMITRLLSTSLRHGSPLNAVVSQLSKCEGDVTTFSKVLMRVLKKYITDEEYIEASNCRSCGSKNLVMEQGCLNCADCGYAACE